MAFDYEGWMREAEEREAKEREAKEREAKAQAEEQKSTWEKIKEVGGDVLQTVGGMASDTAAAAGKLVWSGAEFAFSQVLGRPEDGSVASSGKELENLQEAAKEAVYAPWKRPVQELIAAHGEEQESLSGKAARYLRKSSANIEYYMADEEKLAMARRIEQETGIPAASVLYDSTAYREALDVYDYTRKARTGRGDAFDMERDVWQEFPQLADIAAKDVQGAALVLHDMESLRTAHGVVDTFWEMLEFGNKKLEFDNLQYKLMNGKGDENDMRRAVDLARELVGRRELPGLLDEPLTVIAGDMAISLPEMWQGFRRGFEDAGKVATITAAIGAVVGTFVEPGGGTAIGGAGGAAAGEGIEAALAFLASAGTRSAATRAAGYGFRYGMFEGMYEPETGSRYYDFINLKDKDGHLLMDAQAARKYARIGGAANAAIEMMNAGPAMRLVAGGGHAAKVIRTIVSEASANEAARASLGKFVQGYAKDTLKIAATESVEESLQSLSDDLIHNDVVRSSGGRAAERAWTGGEMAQHALSAGVEAFPAGLGFGVSGAAGALPLGVARHAQLTREEQRQHTREAQRTLLGTLMLGHLQEALAASKLKDTAPDVQRELIRAEVAGKGFETAYIDTAMAIRKENGLDDLKKVAKAAGVENEELETAIAQKGHLAVPVEVYAQAKASPELLESVSFSADTDSMARMKERAQEIREAMKEAHEEAVKQQLDIMDAALGEWFPVAENVSEERKRRMEQERDMASAALLTRTDNPMQGWHELYRKAKQAHQAMLQPALDALARGMKQGVDIVQNEDGSGVRVSNNERWYRDFYKEHGRAPTQVELHDMARAMVAGEATAPKVEGWHLADLSASELEELERTRTELDRLDENIEMLESIKERMKELDGVELKLTAGLTAEGYSVYRRVMADLKSIGSRASKAARMNAVLLARHADLYAKAIAEKTGKKFTAMDYYHTFMIQAGREGDAAGGLHQRAVEKEKEAVRKQYAGTALWMKAPNGKATNLTEDQWLTVRTPAFKAWFGDWEQVAEAVPKINVKNIQEAKTVLHELGNKPIENKATGIVASVSKRGRGKLISAGTRRLSEENGYTEEEHLLAAANTEQLFRNAVLSDAREDRNGDLPSVKLFSALVMLNKKPAVACFTVKETTNAGHKVYSVQMLELKDPAGTLPRSAVKRSSATAESSVVSIAELADKYNTVSKVVDENGEPLVVYHATLSDFTKFRPSESGLYGRGIYLTADKEDTSYTLKDKDWRVMELFANIRNPRDPEAMATREDIEAAKKEALDFFEKHPFDKDGTPASFVVNNLLFWGMQPGKVKKSKLTQVLQDAFARKGVAYQESDKHDGAIIQRDGATWYTADQPNQVKSATGNTGAFSAADEDVYHQSKEIVSRAEERLREDEKRWNALIDRYDAADKVKWKKEKDGEMFPFMDVPLVMMLLDVSFDQVQAYGSFFAHSVNKDHPGMTLDLLRQLPRKMTDPLMVTRGNKPDSYVFVVDLKDSNGATVVVPIAINKRLATNHATVNIVNSAFGKTRGKNNNIPSLNWFAKQLDEGTVIYVNKKESAAWMQSYGNDFPAATALNRAFSKFIVSRKFQNVKTETDLEAARRSSFGVYQRARNADQGQIFKDSAGRRVIELFEGADASTFLHEMGHMFLMDLEDLARLEDAASRKDLATVDEWASWREGAAKDYEGSPWEEEFKAREQAIIDAHAAGDVPTEERLKGEWRQERFARGFEIYLREGKAPSSVLRSVFRKFKEFLRRIYRSAIAMGARPSANVEAVMARMVATEEEIRAASLDERYRSVEDAGGEKLFTETERETYERWKREAEEEAEEALRVLVMRDLEERGRKELAESVQEEEGRKREELEKEPVYMAEAAMEASGDADVVLHWFSSREVFQEERARRKGLEEELRAHVRAYEARREQERIASHFTEENIAKAMQSPKAYKKRLALEAAAYRRKERLLNRVGKKADAAMEELEAAIKDAPEHLDFVAEKETEEAKKVQKAAARLRYSAKWDEEELREIDELRAAGTKEEMAERLEAFRRKAGERRRKERAKARPNRESAEGQDRGFAEDLLKMERMFCETVKTLMRERPVAESCNPNFYRQRERRYARTALKMIKAGRWDMARLAKRQQAMAAACAFAAEKNKEELEKLLAGVERKLGARTVRLAAQERYWLHHLAYLLRLKKKDAPEPEAGAKDLAVMFQGYEESLDVHAAEAPAALLRRLLARDFDGYKALTLDEFAGAVNVMNVLYSIGRDMFKMKAIEGKDVQDIVAEIMASKSRLAPKPVEEHVAAPDRGGVGYNDLLASLPGIGEKMALLGQSGMLNLMKPELEMRLLGEEAHRYIYGLYERAQMHEAELLDESRRELARIFSKFTQAERRGWSERRIKVGKNAFSKENVFCMALNWGTEVNRLRLLDGVGEKVDVPKLLEENMTAKDWQAVQAVWDHVDSFWRDTARTEEKLNGMHLQKVEASSFRIRTADGKEASLAGGYYPIRYNAAKSSKAHAQEIEEAAKREMVGAQVLGTGRGFTKRRSKERVARELLLEFSVLQDHLFDVAHNIAFRIPARDVYRLLHDPTFEAYVSGVYGKEFWAHLNAWAIDCWRIVDAAGDKAAGWLNKAMAAFRRNSTVAIMGYRLWPVLENVTNIAPMADELGVEALPAVGDYYAHKAKMDVLLRKSSFMSDRINNMERDIRMDSHVLHPTHKVTEWLRDHAYRPLTYTDLILSRPLWCRVYKNAFPEKLAEVTQEMEDNKALYRKLQEDVMSLRGKMHDRRRARSRVQEERRRRPHMTSKERVESTSPFATHSDDALSEADVNLGQEIKALERELFEAGRKLEKASELPALQGKALIEEAEMRAVQAADRSVRNVFGSGQTKDLSAIQRSRDEAVKTFTSFYCYFNTQFNAVLSSYFKGKYAEGAAGWRYAAVWMPFAQSVLLRLVLVGAIGGLMRFALGLEGDDERAKYRTVTDSRTGKRIKVEVSQEERMLRAVGKNLLSTTTGTVPFLRDLAGLAGGYVFDGTARGRGLEFGSVAARALKEGTTMVDLMIRKGEKDLELEEKRQRAAQRYRKMTPKQRKAYDEKQKHRRPERSIGYVDLAKAGAEALTSLTAASTGITSTMTDAVFTTMQRMLDTDDYYDPDWVNLLRSVLFDRKLKRREAPPAPPVPPRKKGKQRGRTRQGRRG